MYDFTQEKYQKICEAVRANYTSITFNEYLTQKLPPAFVILRHDIDRMENNALMTAKIEASLGLKASYYFRMPKTFNPGIIKEIAKLGHEVGYHYECLDQAKGNFPRAVSLFNDNLKEFRRLTKTQTICMHGNPLTKFDNRDLWQKYDYRKFGIVGETYLDLSSNITYVSDTGRTWSNQFKVKDFPVNIKPRNYNLTDTDSLIKLLNLQKFSQICILTHPERWSKNGFEWLAYYLFDQLVRIFKSFKKPNETILIKPKKLVLKSGIVL